MFKLSRLATWRPRHLLGAWTAWWITLAGVTLWPLAVGIWRIRRATEEGAFTVSLSMDDGTFRVTLSDAATTLWNAAAGAGTIAFWIGGPPLLLWAAWLWSSRKAASARPHLLHGAEARPLQRPAWEPPASSASVASRANDRDSSAPAP